MSSLQAIAFRLTRLLRSKFRRRESVAALNHLANDGTMTRQARALAVFALFATHVEPDHISADMRSVFTNLAWLTCSKVTALNLSFGPPVLHWQFDESVFLVTLFPDANADSIWMVYFGLSGAQRPEIDGSAFLHGDQSLESSPCLTQFALVSWTGRNHYTERFTRTGVTTQECHYEIQPKA